MPEQASQREVVVRGGPLVLLEDRVRLVELLARGVERLAKTALPDVDCARDLSVYPGVNSTETETQW